MSSSNEPARAGIAAPTAAEAPLYSVRRSVDGCDMDCRPDRLRSENADFSTRPSARGSAARFGLAAWLLLLGWAFAAGPALADRHHRHATRSHGDRGATEAARGFATAVAAPNVRFEIAYDFLGQDATDLFDASGPTSLSIDDHEGHASRAALTGTFPIWGPVGARAQLRGAYGHRQRSLDGLSRGNNEITTTGATVELLLRDPNRGALAIGGDYDRLARKGPIDAEEFGGHATAQLFFPDLGMGPVDWTLHFGFTHRQVDGVGGTADVDADRYLIRAQSGWYASENVQILMGLQWDRAEEEFSSEEDLEGVFEARWFLPVPIVPIELRAGASVGVSEYKRPPFRADKRTVYGATVGLVFRFGAGQSLIETQRRFD